MMSECNIKIRESTYSREQTAKQLFSLLKENRMYLFVANVPVSVTFKHCQLDCSNIGMHPIYE